MFEMRPERLFYFTLRPLFAHLSLVGGATWHFVRWALAALPPYVLRLRAVRANAYIRHRGAAE
jgi:hypothetical protein